MNHPAELALDARSGGYDLPKGFDGWACVVFIALRTLGIARGRCGLFGSRRQS